MTGLRAFIDRNRPLVGVVLGVLIASIWWFVLKPSNRTPNGSVYYLDLKAMTLFSAAEVEPSPISSPSGNEAVKAFVYSCSTCDDDAFRFIGYLEKYSEAYKQALRSGSEMSDDVAYNGEMFGTPDGKTWLPKLSEAGQALVISLAKKCGGDKITPCLP